MFLLVKYFICPLYDCKYLLISRILAFCSKRERRARWRTVAGVKHLDATTAWPFNSHPRFASAYIINSSSSRIAPSTDRRLPIPQRFFSSRGLVRVSPDSTTSYFSPRSSHTTDPYNLVCAMALALIRAGCALYTPRTSLPDRDQGSNCQAA